MHANLSQGLAQEALAMALADRHRCPWPRGQHQSPGTRPPRRGTARHLRHIAAFYNRTRRPSSIGDCSPDHEAQSAVP